ncbi:hypothetical protein ABIB75_007378, partial [Bradyrhizobium sp. GM2.2]
MAARNRSPAELAAAEQMVCAMNIAHTAPAQQR